MSQASNEQVKWSLPQETEEPSTPVLASVKSSNAMLEDVNFLPSPEKVLSKLKSGPNRSEERRVGKECPV